VGVEVHNGVVTRGKTEPLQHPFYIARWNERDYVMTRSQNGNYDMIRQASAADIINLPKLPA
jgi:hypothetical protein